MLAEIITIGDEILIGQVVDTNSAYIARELNKIGIKVYQITSVQDVRDHILKALANAKDNANIVFITGGLGPTKDDITKSTLCEFFNDTLVENSEVLAHVNFLFSKHFDQKPLASNLRQAMVPSRATVLLNEHGTAPGLWMEQDATVFVSLPGVPYEMKYLLQNRVIPIVVKKYDRPFIYHKTLLTYGKGESEVANTIEDFENELPSEIRLAYLPSLGKVRLRLSSTGSNEKLLKAGVNAQMDALYKILEDIAVGFEDETSIEDHIGALLVKNNQSMSLAESFTGGTIASRITANAGASAYFKGALVPYETRLKSKILGIAPELIKKYNVVSIPVAEAMASHARSLFDTDFAVATTGIAGPSKGDGVDEVGTVCIAVAGPKKLVSAKFSFGKARERVIIKAVNKALEMLYKEILKN